MLIADWSRAGESGVVSLVMSLLRGGIFNISKCNVMSVAGSVVGSDLQAVFRVKLANYFRLASFVQALTSVKNYFAMKNQLYSGQ